MNGFLNLLKPPGMSSGAAVACVKRLFREKTGHAGTLDPEAAGVLPVMIGRAARLLPYFSQGEKEYIAEVSFRGATDTQDAQGEITENGIRIPDEEEIQNALMRFTGEITQKTPVYSAAKQNGVPLYKLARRGEKAVGKERNVQINEIRYLSKTEDGALIRVDCGSGTYIRTLCHDIGAALQAPAHMKFLLRTKVGVFLLQDTVSLEQLEEAECLNTLSSFLMPMDFPLQHLPSVFYNGESARKAKNGVSLPAPADAEDGMLFKVYADGFFCAVARCMEGKMMMQTVVLPDGQK